MSTDDLAAARTAHEQLWDALRLAIREQRMDDWEALLHPQMRTVFAHPAPGSPPAVEGRERVGRMMRRFRAAIEDIDYRDVRLHQTTDPHVAWLEYELVVSIGDRSYPNRYATRITTQDGLLAEIVEHCGQREHEALLAAVALSSRGR